MQSATLRWNSMARLNAKNNAETVLAQAVSETDTVFIVEDAGALPDVPFRLSIEDEIVEVSAVDGNALTVERAVEDTQAGSYDVGTAVENRFTAGMYGEMVTFNELPKIPDEPEIMPGNTVVYHDNSVYEMSGGSDGSTSPDYTLKIKRSGTYRLEISAESFLDTSTIGIYVDDNRLDYIYIDESDTRIISEDISIEEGQSIVIWAGGFIGSEGEYKDIKLMTSNPYAEKI